MKIIKTVCHSICNEFLEKDQFISQKDLTKPYLQTKSVFNKFKVILLQWA